MCDKPPIKPLKGVQSSHKYTQRAVPGQCPDTLVCSKYFKFPPSQEQGDKLYFGAATLVPVTPFLFTSSSLQSSVCALMKIAKAYVDTVLENRKPLTSCSQKKQSGQTSHRKCLGDPTWVGGVYTATVDGSRSTYEARENTDEQGQAPALPQGLPLGVQSQDQHCTVDGGGWPWMRAFWAIQTQARHRRKDDEMSGSAAPGHLDVRTALGGALTLPPACAQEGTGLLQTAPLRAFPPSTSVSLLKYCWGHKCLGSETSRFNKTKQKLYKDREESPPVLPLFCLKTSKDVSVSS